MSKVKSEHLFSLIKSLNRSEKRYFRLFASREETHDMKYLSLFDRMDAQQKYDEELILREDSRLIRSQMSNLKAHLFKRILQSLRQYEMEKTTEIKLREMIDYVQLLHDRGLYKHSADVLKKAYRIVDKTDNLELKLDLLKWEKNLINKMVGKDYQQKVRKIICEVEDTSKKINLINQFTNLSVQLNAVYVQTGYIRNERHYWEIKNLFYNHMPKFTLELLSLHEKMSLYKLYVHYYYFMEEMDEGYKYALRWLRLFDSKPHLIESQKDDYLSAINQVMIAEFKLYRHEPFMKNRQRLHDLYRIEQKSVNENIRNRLIKYIWVHEFNRIFMLGKFSSGVKLLHRIGNDLDDFIIRSDEHSRIILFYKIACLYFGNEQYGKSLEYLNRVLKDEKEDLREDIHSFARILSLIAHYELGNVEVIDYYIRSAYRFLLKKGDLQFYHKYILRFLRKIASGFTEEQLIPEFELLLEKLRPLQNIRYEKRAFIYFDIIAWLESKIMGKTVQTRIQERAKEKIAKQRDVPVDIK